MTNMRRSSLVRVLPVLLMLAACRSAFALTYGVDRIDDDASQTACTAAPNDCTLRGAVIASNNHTNQGGPDVINLPAGTYTLSIAGAGEDFSATGDLDVRDTVSIFGEDATTTIIDGGGLDRVIQTDPTGGGAITVIISSVTIQNGNVPQIASTSAEGGGIRNGASSLPVSGTPAGTLHLGFATVTGNTSAKSGGGISNDGTMTIGNCLISNNVSGFLASGGGIVQDDEGSLDISGTTIRDNDADKDGTAAGSGGGISIGFFSTTAAPTVTFEACTISGNTARTAGGLQRTRGSVTMRNMTISGNVATQSSGAGGGGIGDLGFTNGLQPTMVVKSATITNNSAGGTDGGGGLNASGAGTRVANSIIAGNSGNGTPSDVIGNLISESHNLIGKATGFTVDVSSDTTGDIEGVAPSDLHLGPLVHESGPPTETHALLFGSPAIDAGSTAAPQSDYGCANTDQRASTRPRDGDGDGIEICDIGAYEVFDALPSPTPSSTPHPGETATLTPTPTATVTPDPGSEICDNCVDDDGDGLVDRDDPGCDQPYDGAGQGIDPARAKQLVKCASAIAKAGAKAASKRLGRLQKCIGKVIPCVQLKGFNDPCVTKARAACNTIDAGLAADDAKLVAIVTKACGAPLLPDDLRGAQGLGYDGHAYRCGLVNGAAPVDASSVAACVATEHACRIGAVLAPLLPRADEMLQIGNHGFQPCSLSFGGTGVGLGDVVRDKRVVKCEQALAKAGAKLVNGEVKLVPKCASAVFACLQLAKPGCAPKSRATCAKTGAKVNALASKLAAAVTKACAASGLAFADVLDTSGVGFANLAPSCQAADVPNLTSVADATACITRFQQCRARQLLENEFPRLRELLGTGQLALP